MAISTSDWHLDDSVPSYRANEPDWWAAQQRPIEQIKALKEQYKCPILFAGDLFNKWKATPELINWAIKHVPVMYSIPGNHDLPNHRYDDIHKCGYWTLVQAGVLIDIKHDSPYPINDSILVYGFPFGKPIRPAYEAPLVGMNVALIHAYCWKKGTGYVGADREHRVGSWESRLQGYQIACIGDNHHPFLWKGKATTIVNNGCINRRRADEADYSPGVYLIWSDGEVSRKNLDCKLDVYAERIKQTEERDEIDTTQLIESLSKLRKNRIDFEAVVQEVLTVAKVNEGVRSKVMEAMG